MKNVRRGKCHIKKGKTFNGCLRDILKRKKGRDRRYAKDSDKKISNLLVEMKINKTCNPKLFLKQSNTMRRPANL